MDFILRIILRPIANMIREFIYKTIYRSKVNKNLEETKSLEQELNEDEKELKNANDVFITKYKSYKSKRKSRSVREDVEE